VLSMIANNVEVAQRPIDFSHFAAKALSHFRHLTGPLRLFLMVRIP